MLERVQKTITRYNMLPRGGRVAVAVSGGPDSVCLLHVLFELAPSWGISLAVAHLNHQLRGAESVADESFVAALAQRLGLPFYPASADVAAAADNLEQAGRRARQAFFVGLPADRVALGHTRDDQAETVLFRLLRGSGLRGLAGIHPVSEPLAVARGSVQSTLSTTPQPVSTAPSPVNTTPPAAGARPSTHGAGRSTPCTEPRPEGADSPPTPLYIRPLIDITRAEIEEFLRARGIPWREDASNRDPRFARNRIRATLLPQLTRDWNPRIAESLAHLATLAQDEEHWWRAQIDDLAAGLLLPRAGGIELRASALTALPLALSRRLVRAAVTQAKGDLRRLEYPHVERVLKLAAQPEGNGRLRLPGLDVRRSFDWIRLAPSAAGLELPVTQIAIPGVYPLTSGACLHLEIAQNSSAPPILSVPSFASSSAPSKKDATLKAAELSLRRLPAVLELRGWKPGDHYRPVGQIRDQKIQEMFQSERVPSWQRPAWPIIGSGDKILWAKTFGAAAEFAARPELGPVVRIWEGKPPNS